MLAALELTVRAAGQKCRQRRSGAAQTVCTTAIALIQICAFAAILAGQGRRPDPGRLGSGTLDEAKADLAALPPAASVWLLLHIGQGEATRDPVQSKIDILDAFRAAVAVKALADSQDPLEREDWRLKYLTEIRAAGNLAKLDLRGAVSLAKSGDVPLWRFCDGLLVGAAQAPSVSGLDGLARGSYLLDLEGECARSGHYPYQGVEALVLHGKIPEAVAIGLMRAGDEQAAFEGGKPDGVIASGFLIFSHVHFPALDGAVESSAKDLLASAGPASASQGPPMATPGRELPAWETVGVRALAVVGLVAPEDAKELRTQYPEFILAGTHYGEQPPARPAPTAAMADAGRIERELESQAAGGQPAQARFNALVALARRDIGTSPSRALKEAEAARSLLSEKLLASSRQAMGSAIVLARFYAKTGDPEAAASVMNECISVADADWASAEADFAAGDAGQRANIEGNYWAGITFGNGYPADIFAAAAAINHQVAARAAANLDSLWLRPLALAAVALSGHK